MNVARTRRRNRGTRGRNGGGPLEVFQLHANCCLVKGIRRSLICDLQKTRGFLIPNGLHHILTTLRGYPVDQIKRRFSPSNAPIIDEYFRVLVEKDYGFMTDEAERFPRMDLSWDRPEKITNAIVDVKATSDHDFPAIFEQLEHLGCEAIQVRYFDVRALRSVREVVRIAENGHARHLDLILKYSNRDSIQSLSRLCREHQIISGINVHSSPREKVIRVGSLPVYIVFRQQPLDLACCGQVSPKFFTINLEHFTEAQHFNTCLNRKIAVSADGEIRNCPSMPGSYGNVGTRSLESAVKEPGFKTPGLITKDQIHGCRDCEFRYICTDCRAYTATPNDPLSKPAKCTYDPSRGSWMN